MQISFKVTVYNPLKSRVGVSKAPFVDFFIMDFLRKYLLGFFQSHSYFNGVAAILL